MWVRGERIDLRLSAPSGLGQSVDMVRELPLRARDGSLIPLGEVASVDLAFGEDAIYRHDGMRTITLRSDVTAAVSTVDFEADARVALAGLPLPPGVKIEFGGESEERDRSNSSLASALKWGILAIYMIIAIQFNSIRQPFIVLITIPLSLIGVVLGLLVTGRPFSFLVFIGIVSLTGIVVNDGIVMVDSINQKRRSGMPLRDAILEAAVGRLRPVILTTLTTIAGLLPLTLGVGDGGEFWVPLGIAIISGILVASSLTLFVIPVLYSLAEEGPEGRRARQTVIRPGERSVSEARVGAQVSAASATRGDAIGPSLTPA